MRKRLVKENPVEHVTMPAARSRSRFLQPHELEAFEAAVEAEEQPWRDLFLRNGTWLVPGAMQIGGIPPDNLRTIASIDLHRCGHAKNRRANDLVNC